MEITEHTHGAVAVIRPEGPLVRPDAEEVKTRLLDVGAGSLGRVVLDLSETPYVDSRGLEVLIEVAEELSRSGKTLKLCATNDVLREVFELTDLAAAFDHYPDVNAAVRSFL